MVPEIGVVDQITHLLARRFRSDDSPGRSGTVHIAYDELLLDRSDFIGSHTDTIANFIQFLFQTQDFGPVLLPLVGRRVRREQLAGIADNAHHGIFHAVEL